MQTDTTLTVNPAPKTAASPETSPRTSPGTSPVGSPTPPQATPLLASSPISSPTSLTDTPPLTPADKTTGSSRNPAHTPAHTLAPSPALSPETPPEMHSAYNIWRNSKQSWGYIAAIFHWLSALAIFALFPLGLWMTGLAYYDSWYKLAPDLHKSIGLSLFGVLLARVAWRIWDPAPAPVPGHKTWERHAAHAAHLVLYIIVFAVMFSGYLISTADGRAIPVFGLFDVPATITSIPKQEDVAGLLHFWLAITLIGTAVVHGGAALKHHFLDKDSTLLRMFGIRMIGRR